MGRARRPVIGITCGTSSKRGQTERYGLNQVYVQSVADAGGAPVLVPPMERTEAVTLLQRLDGLLVPGGADIHPSFYGQRPGAHLEETDKARDSLEMVLIRSATRRCIPVFAICRGMQMLNVAFGGTLYQDIKTETGSKVRHNTPKSWGRDRLAHSVDIEPDSWFAETTHARHLDVNSLHHQAVRDIGRGLRVTATSPDGIIEGLETSDRRVVAVQCHPEELQSLSWARSLFRSFVASARD